MKKLIAVAGLCIAAFVVAPVASASAETITGNCAIKGVAEFTNKNLKPEAETGIEYKFTGTGVCSGETGTGEKIPAETAATVTVEKGTFGSTAPINNACVAAKSETEATGHLKAAGKEFEFKLAFEAQAGDVTLSINGGAAKGTAEFVTSTKSLAAECITAGSAGIKELTFLADAAGTI